MAIRDPGGDALTRREGERSAYRDAMYEQHNQKSGIGRLMDEDEKNKRKEKVKKRRNK